jgi:hypothetical protein
MTTQAQAVELDIRRKSQELAVAWRKGKAAYVLDSLSREEPLRAALIATLIHEALARWDPYDSRWPNGFRHALLGRSQGKITAEEYSELEQDYRRQFGSSPPRPRLDNPNDQQQCLKALKSQVQSIRTALETGVPIVRERSHSTSVFLRPQPARR